MSDWIKGAPIQAGTYLVASDLLQEVAQARYKPRIKEWVFPSAAMAFNVTHYQPMPAPPLPASVSGGHQQEPKP